MRAQEFTTTDDEAKDKFRGQYPSIQTTLGEAKYPGVVDYEPGQEKKLHQNLDISKGVDIGTFDRFDIDKKKWHDLAFVQDYSEGSFDLNDYLHRHYRNKTKPKDVKQHLLHIQAMDRALAKHKLKEKVVVYTGLIESPANAWEIHGADVTKPIRLHLPAYTSTTTSLRIAVNHADDHDINMGRELRVPKDRHKPRNKDAPRDEFGTQILMLVLPAGSPAASIKNVSEWEAENEILLPRGANIEIDPRPTVTRNRVYIWHARVLGYSPVLVAAPAVKENFADGKKSGRKGLAKRVGVNCKQPISKLRSIASHSSGEKQRMAHWCANMKSGKQK